MATCANRSFALLMLFPALSPAVGLVGGSSTAGYENEGPVQLAVAAFDIEPGGGFEAPGISPAPLAGPILIRLAPALPPDVVEDSATIAVELVSLEFVAHEISLEALTLPAILTYTCSADSQSRCPADSTAELGGLFELASGGVAQFEIQITPTGPTLPPAIHLAAYDADGNLFDHLRLPLSAAEPSLPNRVFSDGFE